MQIKIANQKPTFGQLLNKYSKAARNDRPLKKRLRSPPHQGAPSSPRGESSKRRGDVVTMFPPQQMQPMYATMPWAPPASDPQFPAWENGGIWMQCYPMPYPPHFQGERSSRGPVFDRLRQPVHDRLGQHQSGQGQNPGPVRPVYPDRLDRSQQRPVQVRSVRQEYRVKEKKDEPVPMQVDSEKAPGRIVQIEDGKSKTQDAQKDR